MTALIYPDVAPGTIGLVAISGQVGKLIHVGQFLAETPMRKWLQRNNEPDYEHAFIYLGATEEFPEGAVLEAEPGGARIVSVSEYPEWTVYWCDMLAAKFAASLPDVAQIAPEYKDVPYSFLDYFFLAAHRLHVWLPGLRSYIKSTKHQICSQLSDFIYQEAGAHLFADWRWPGDVMPMDLYLLDQSLAFVPAG